MTSIDFNKLGKAAEEILRKKAFLATNDLLVRDFVEIKNRLRSAFPPEKLYRQLAYALRRHEGCSFMFLDSNHADIKVQAFWASPHFPSLMKMLGIKHNGYEFPASTGPLFQLVKDQDYISHYDFTIAAASMNATNRIDSYVHGMALYFSVALLSAYGNECRAVDAAADQWVMNAVSEYEKCGIKEFPKLPADNFQLRMDDTENLKLLKHFFGENRFALIFGAGHATGINPETGQPKSDFKTLMGDKLILVGLHNEEPYRRDGLITDYSLYSYDYIVDLRTNKILEVTKKLRSSEPNRTAQPA